MTSRQRKAERKASGQTRYAMRLAKDNARELAKLASGSGRVDHSSREGKRIIADNRARQWCGSGKWTSYPFHHGRTFVRKILADKASRYAL